LFAGDASGRSPRIRAQKFKPPRFCAPESLDFEDDLILGVLFHAQDAACQIPLVGPEMDERILSLAAKLAMQPGKFCEPFTILANFHAAGR
jgi:hypothetical protein